jgi:hypothetical protein
MSVDDKARAIVAGGGVTIRYRHPSGVAATVAGASGGYVVAVDAGSAWCSCAATATCSHILAVRLVLEAEPDAPDDGEGALEGDAGSDGEGGSSLAVRPAAALVDLATAPVTWRTLEALSRTEFVPKGLRDRPAAVLGAVLLGRDHGLGPVEALRLVDVVDGRPSLSSELLMRLYRGAGHRVEIERADTEAVELVGTRGDNGDTVTVTYTLTDAERAGLVRVVDGRPIARSRQGKPLPWETHTADMLWARAVTRLVRRLAPDCLASGGRP